MYFFIAYSAQWNYGESTKLCFKHNNLNIESVSLSIVPQIDFVIFKNENLSSGSVINNVK